MRAGVVDTIRRQSYLETPDEMNCHLTTRFGRCIQNPSDQDIDRALEELSIEDNEHPDTSITIDGEWCISLFPSGLAVFENLEHGEPRHLRDVSVEDAKVMWALFVSGDLAELSRLSWKSGYG